MSEDQEEESKEPPRETYRRKAEESWRWMAIPTVVTEKGKLKASILLGGRGCPELPAGTLWEEENVKGIELSWVLLLRPFSG